MGPLTAWAENVAPKTVSPNRMAFLYVPNGIHMADWTPKQEGSNFELSPILAPLAEGQVPCNLFEIRATMLPRRNRLW